MSQPRLKDGPVPWVYYWLDLYGPSEPGQDARPANSKVLVSWGFFLTLVAEVWWGFALTRPRCWEAAEHVTECTTPVGITWPYVVLVLSTLAAAMGKDVFKAAIKIKEGGG